MLGVCGLIMAVVTTWTVQTKSSVSGDKSLLPAGAGLTVSAAAADASAEMLSVSPASDPVPAAVPV